MSRRAAIYCRISQAPDGTLLGVERQEPPCRRLCEQRGWAVAGVYVDNDLSASRFARKPRPDYERMLADARAGAATAIVVLDPDRLTRRPVENEEIIDLAERHGIALANVAGDIDLATATGRLQFRLLGAVAAHESELKSERVRRKMAQKALAGEDAGGIRAFGRGPDRVSLHPGEALLVAEAAGRLLAGEGLRTVAADWTGRGIVTTRGQPWSAPTLRRLLLSPRVYGARTHLGQVVKEDAWPPILDRPTWQQLRALLLDPARQRGGHPHVYLLSGIAACWACGLGLIGDPKRRVAFYGCRGRRRQCGRVQVNAHRLDEVIVEAVLLRLDGDGLERQRAALQADEPAWRLLAEQERADEAALGELAHARFTERSIEHRDYLREYALVSARLQATRAAQARRVRSQALDGLPDGPGELRAWWADPETTTLQRRAVLRAVLERVVVGPGRPYRFDPARVLPPYGPVWRDRREDR